MKTVATTAAIVLGLATLTACGSQTPDSTGETPDATEAALPAPETPDQPADEMVAKPDTGVDVTLPNVPLSNQPAAPAPEASKPAPSQ